MTAVRANVHPLRPLAPTPDELDVLALERLARGEIQALGELYERHHTALYRFIARVTGGSGDVDDLVHNAFLSVPAAAKSYDGRAPARSWLLGIAARHVQRRGRSLGRLGRMLSRLRDDLVGHGAVDPGPERTAMVNGEMHVLEAALARLTEAKRVVLVMAEVEGLSCDDIAAALEIPVGTVWTRLHHARREVRASFDKRDRRDSPGGAP